MPRCPNPRCQADYPAGTIQCTNPFCQCLLPEAVIAGRYRIETLIGMGGMGAVYRASDTFEMCQIALKVLKMANNPMDFDTAVERFRREARYTHQFRHKNIVPVLNFGQDGPHLYLTMPLVTGGSLKALLKGERPLPPLQAQRYLNDLAAALDAIHHHPQQIIHRDIKPSNLLIHQDDGRLVVTDFGIARAMQQEKALTQGGWALGTEHYSAPEQEHGKPEPASDIYAMGVVAYQMLTGLLPFQAVVKSRAAQLPEPSTLNIALPPAIDAVVLRAIDIDPEKRYQTASAFADAINQALAGADMWSAPTVASIATATSNANIVVHTLVPENPCSRCGRENRSTSRFCRHCGHTSNDTSPLVTATCQVGYASDIGHQATNNEDMLLIVQGLCISLMPPRPFSLFAVADGLLGPQNKAAGGHEASNLAIDTLADVMLPLLTNTSGATNSVGSPPGPLRPPTHAPPLKQVDTLLEDWLRGAVRQANQVIYHCNADYDTSMASTLTAALLYNRRLLVAHVGDSRAYHYNATRGLQRITTDHTLAANLVEANLISPEELYESSKRNHHYRNLGQNYHIQVDLFQRQVEFDDLILLCTDGLWHMVRDERIQEILAQGGDIQALAQVLTESANNAGGEGNISAIVIRVQ